MKDGIVISQFDRLSGQGSQCLWLKELEPMTTNLKFAKPAAVALGLIAFTSAIPAYAADVVMEEPPAPVAPVAELPSPRGPVLMPV